MKINKINKYIFSPAIIYLIGFVFPLLLVFIGFSNHVNYPSIATMKVIIYGVAGFYLGLFLASVFFNFYINRRKINVTSEYKVVIVKEKVLFKLLIFLWCLGITMLWFEFYQLGSLPLLSSNVEELRFQLQYNGYTHLLAISSGFIAFVFFALVFISEDKRLKVVYLALICITILSLLLTANRMDFMYPLFLMVIFYIVYTGNILSKRMVALVVIGVVVFIALNIFRSSGYSDDYINDNYSGLGVGFEPNSLNLFLYPFYMTLTYSFEMLNKLVNANIEGVTKGMYTFYAFISLEPGHHESFGEFKNRMLNIDFYAELTSTYLSNFYVDFGGKGVFVCSLIYAMIIQLVWNFFNINKAYILLYVVVIAPLFFLFYAFYYVYFYAFFQIGVILFVSLFLKDKVQQEA